MFTIFSHLKTVYFYTNLMFYFLMLSCGGIAVFIGLNLCELLGMSENYTVYTISVYRWLYQCCLWIFSWEGKNQK